jgi:hypothetical protein
MDLHHRQERRTDRNMDRRSVLSLWVRRAAGAGLALGLPNLAWPQAFSLTEARGALRAALSQAAAVAVAQLGRPEGFLSNDKVRLGLPDALEKASPVLRTIGQGDKLEAFTNALNVAAAELAAAAGPALNQAIARAALPEPLKLLQGHQHALTVAFSEGQRAALTDTLRPVAQAVVDRSDLGSLHADLNDKAKSTSASNSTGAPVSVQAHLLQKTLDGLFFVMGEEERRLRNAPAKSGSPLIRKVFGAL